MDKRETFAHALCAILVKHKLFNEAEGRALQRSFKGSAKENFDDFLLEEGLIDEAPLLNALSEFYQVPAVDVTGYFADTLLVRNFPKDFLVRNRVLPLEMEDDFLIVVASNPDDPELLIKLGAYTSEDIQFRVGLARDIMDSIREFYDKSPTDITSDDDLLDEELEEKETFHDLLEEDEDDLKMPTVSEDSDSEDEEV